MARSFGVRFIEEFRRAGGSTDKWPSDAITALASADRRRFIDVLSKVSSASAKTLVIAAHTAEPETLARRAVTLTAREAADDDSWLLMLAAFS